MKVLFICRANVGRSQMAAAIFNKISKNHKAISAGTHVEQREGQNLDEFVVKCMAEMGYDLSRKTMRQLNRDMVKEADKIIVLTDKEDLPDYIRDSPNVVFWSVEDGKGRPYGFVCKIRDEIKSLVERLVADID